MKVQTIGRPLSKQYYTWLREQFGAFIEKPSTDIEALSVAFISLVADMEEIRGASNEETAELFNSIGDYFSKLPNQPTH